MKKIISIIIIAAVVAIVIFLSNNSNIPNSTLNNDGLFGVIESSEHVGIAIGEKAPNFRLETFTGNVIELTNIQRPVVIDFWAGWCPFCLEELPVLEAAYKRYGEEILFLGIHRSETESIQKGGEFALERGVTYELLKDTTGEVYNTYSGGQPFMPLAFFIDESGIIVERVFGPKTKEQIAEKVTKLLE